jgi:hypothetical protein
LRDARLYVMAVLINGTDGRTCRARGVHS